MCMLLLLATLYNYVNTHIVNSDCTLCNSCIYLQLSNGFDIAMAFDKFEAATMLLEDAGGLVSDSVPPAPS